MLRPYFFYGPTVPYRPLPSQYFLVRSPHAVVLPSGDSFMRRLLITTFLVVPALLLAQDPPPAPRDTTKKADTTAVKDTLLPLKMARTVSFETSEATWMSLPTSRNSRCAPFSTAAECLLRLLCRLSWWCHGARAVGLERATMRGPQGTS